MYKSTINLSKKSCIRYDNKELNSELENQNKLKNKVIHQFLKKGTDFFGFLSINFDSNIPL